MLSILYILPICPLYFVRSGLIDAGKVLYNPGNYTRIISDSAQERVGYGYRLQIAPITPDPVRPAMVDLRFQASSLRRLYIIIIIILLSTPFYFTRGGVVDLSTGSLRNVGRPGYYWSSTATATDSNTYRLYFDSADTKPSSSYARWLGFLVR